jgi:hypothetical protein
MAQAALRSYSSTYSYDNGNYQNSSSISGSGAGGLVLLANAGGGHVKVVTGNTLISSNTRLDIDSNGIATFYNNVIVSKTNSANYLVSQNTLTTKGFSANVVAKTNSYTVTANDFLIRCDTTAVGFTVTLQPAASSPGQILNIKKVSGDSNALTIEANGIETIDGVNAVSTVPILRLAG